VRHIPHLYLPAPWGDGVIPLNPGAVRHLTKVLRLGPGTGLSYTDGAGTVGDGTLDTTATAVVRGVERAVAPPVPRITLAAAPPHDSARARYLVEKAAELGVAQVCWLATTATQGRPPKPARAQAWATAALQQARAAHLTAIGASIPLAELGSGAVVTERGGGDVDPEWWADGSVTVVVGPEGGLTADEIARFPRRMGLGDRVLRTETAAVVAASLVLDAGRRRNR
jgi:16S rRNA (uracil1498-N3)-methyltransferase